MYHNIPRGFCQCVTQFLLSVSVPQKEAIFYCPPYKKFFTVCHIKQFLSQSLPGCPIRGQTATPFPDLFVLSFSSSQPCLRVTEKFSRFFGFSCLSLSSSYAHPCLSVHPSFIVFSPPCLSVRSPFPSSRSRSCLSVRFPLLPACTPVCILPETFHSPQPCPTDFFHKEKSA